MTTLNFAYKFIAMMLMLAEANFFCAQTGLSPGRSFTEREIRPGGHVGPFNTNNFGGSIVTDQYFFGFGWGHLANFTKRGFMPRNSDQAIRERNLELSTFSSLIDTNGAYQLATNWLGATGVDVRALQAKYRLHFEQWRYYPEGVGGKTLMLPVYAVQWRGHILRSQPERESAVVSVIIFGATKELVGYHVLDDSLFLRPRIQVKEPEKLLAISDADFKSFSSAQRNDLIARFIGPAPAVPQSRGAETESSTPSALPKQSGPEAPFKKPKQIIERKTKVLPARPTSSETK